MENTQFKTTDEGSNSWFQKDYSKLEVIFNAAVERSRQGKIIPYASDRMYSDESRYEMARQSFKKVAWAEPVTKKDVHTELISLDSQNRFVKIAASDLVESNDLKALLELAGSKNTEDIEKPISALAAFEAARKRSEGVGTESETLPTPEETEEVESKAEAEATQPTPSETPPEIQEEVKEESKAPKRKAPKKNSSIIYFNPNEPLEEPVKSQSPTDFSKSDTATFLERYYSMRSKFLEQIKKADAAKERDKARRESNLSDLASRSASETVSEELSIENVPVEDQETPILEPSTELPPTDEESMETVGTQTDEETEIITDELLREIPTEEETEPVQETVNIDEETEEPQTEPTEEVLEVTEDEDLLSETEELTEREEVEDEFSQELSPEQEEAEEVEETASGEAESETTEATEAEQESVPEETKIMEPASSETIALEEVGEAEELNGTPEENIQTQTIETEVLGEPSMEEFETKVVVTADQELKIEVEPRESEAQNPEPKNPFDTLQIVYQDTSNVAVQNEPEQWQNNEATEETRSRVAQLFEDREQTPDLPIQQPLVQNQGLANLKKDASVSMFSFFGSLALLACFTVFFFPQFVGYDYVALVLSGISIFVAWDLKPKTLLITCAVFMATLIGCMVWTVYQTAVEVEFFHYLWFLLIPLCMSTSFAYIHSRRELRQAEEREKRAAIAEMKVPSFNSTPTFTGVETAPLNNEDIMSQIDRIQRRPGNPESSMGETAEPTRQTPAVPVNRNDENERDETKVFTDNLSGSQPDSEETRVLENIKDIEETKAATSEAATEPTKVLNKLPNTEESDTDKSDSTMWGSILSSESDLLDNETRYNADEITIGEILDNDDSQTTADLHLGEALKAKSEEQAEESLKTQTEEQEESTPEPVSKNISSYDDDVQMQRLLDLVNSNFNKNETQNEFSEVDDTDHTSQTVVFGEISEFNEPSSGSAHNGNLDTAEHLSSIVSSMFGTSDDTEAVQPLDEGDLTEFELKESDNQSKN